MINSPTICQIIVSQALEPIRSVNPEATIIQYMDDILVAAPTSDHVDNLVSATSTAAVVWQTQERWQCIKMRDKSLSVQLLEASAVVLACGLFPSEHLNIVTDSMFVARLCQAMSGPGISASSAAAMIEEALFSRQGTISMIHVNSHNPVRGFFQIGNDKADAAAKGLWTLQDARQLYESLHVGAKALVKKCNISIADARHIVATCPHCQKAPLWSSGINPRGLKASEIWQTDFTLCQILKPRAWLAVTVDTYSGMIVATQHAKTSSKATIQHWLTAMAWLGIPKQIKTDNGTNFIARSTQEFATKWNITLKQGILYNSTGQAIVERANQTLKSKLETLAKAEGFTNNIPPPEQPRLLATTMLELNQFPRGDQAQSPSQKHWATEALKEGPPVKIRNELGDWESGWKLVLTGRGLPHIGQGELDVRPYQPCTWTLRNPLDGRVIAQTVSNAPSFIVHISDIFNTDGIGIDPSQGKSFAYINWGTYWCPSVNPGKSYCTYPGYGFCGYWGCETIVTSNQWTPARRDSFLDVGFWPKGCKRPMFGKSGMITAKGSCSHLNVTVLQPQDINWALGRKWSVFLHSWDTDPNKIVQIIRASPPHHTTLGPNRVVAQQYNHINSNPTPSLTSATSALNGALKLMSHALFHRMLNATFLSLNATKPDLTCSCWLCYDAYLPFYEGVALNAMFSYSRANDPKRCLWNTPRKGITLEQVSGKGVCIGNR
ncbi:PREDICTED: endogenous retrovirus group K member 113 Pol protein-like [Pseudopodoces humilis]|uniref:endogenous retrovirus group K member 113 Pol protein-like n=1 Tax=Pseudopodoces humilis TaxID=181119 RepID=UPI0006B84C87|nr:PREDICTED: endogenous retrovirus group K member 113 Pol protein-like [Pseudopodoces humilis]